MKLRSIPVVRTCGALVLGVGLLYALHLQEELIRFGWLAYVLWWIPVLLVTFALYRKFGRREAPDDRVRDFLPELILALCAILYLFSGASHTPWFYMIRWLPGEDGVWSAMMPRFILATALLIPLLYYPRKWTWILVLAALVYSQYACLHALAGHTDWQPLYRDDHPSFMFRLFEIKETFPNLVNFNPYWNGGAKHYVGAISGMLSAGVAFLPLWKLFDVHVLYTPMIAVLFIVLLPIVMAASVRIMGGNGVAAWAAGLLGLGISQQYYLWMIHFGTIGASISSAAIVPFSACVYRAVILKKREKALALGLILSTLALILWPPGCLMTGAVALAFLCNWRQWSRKTIAFLTICAALCLIVYLKPLLVVLFEGKDTMQYVIADDDFANRVKTPVFTSAMFIEGWKLLIKQLREGHPILIFFGIAGVFLTPQRTIRRWYLPVILYFAVLAAWGSLIKPNLQLDRMAIPMFFAAVPPAAFLISRVLGATPASAVLARAAMVALLMSGGYNVSLIYRNQGPATYVSMEGWVTEFAHWVRDSTHEGTRILFAGRTVHAYGGGHLAYLPVYTGREMMACDYYHFPPKYVEYNYPPRPFRTTDEKFKHFMELYNVSHVVTYHQNWKDYVETMPDRFSKVADFDRASVYRVLQEPSMYLKGSGTTEAQFNIIRVRLKEPTEEVVLKYNWDEHFTVPQPATLFPYDAGDDVLLIGVRPSGLTDFELSYKHWL